MLLFLGAGMLRVLAGVCTLWGAGHETRSKDRLVKTDREIARRMV